METLRSKACFISYAIENVLTMEQIVELISALRDMATAMLEEHIIINEDYLVSIFQYFHCLIIEYYPEHMHRPDLCQLIEALLKENASLYQALFPHAQRSRRGQAIRATQPEEEKKKEELRGVLDYLAE